MGRQRGVQAAAFQQRKDTFLAKSDKSSAGGIDVHAREVCAAINERPDAFTTSSCSGRAFLWKGEGVKSTSKFSRYRVTHEMIPDAESYFDLDSLADEVVDGAWEEMHRTREKLPSASTGSTARAFSQLACIAQRVCCWRGDASEVKQPLGEDPVVWLRFEPFILHVCCRDLSSAAALIAAARTVFKNVGAQGWAENKVMVAIWGDEGLEMALSDPHGRALFKDQAAWLQELVNSRHRRNWMKIDRFTEAVRDLPEGDASAACRSFLADASSLSTTDTEELDHADELGQSVTRVGPKHFDVIGDVVVISVLPAEAEQAAIGAKMLADNRKVRIVAARQGSLQTGCRKPGAMVILAGPARSPLMTTHIEFGVRYVVNLEAVFFNPRMGPERQRICSQVQDRERICVLFAGCCPEALQLVDKTEAESVIAVEMNPDAVQCARRSLEVLAKRSADRANRLQVIEGDACVVAGSFSPGSFDRLLAPRPKGDSDTEDDALVAVFLESLVPLLRAGGVCHWYDFVADWEFPDCARSVARIHDACTRLGRTCSILRCAAANSKPVAERQYRTVIDFSVA